MADDNKPADNAGEHDDVRARAVAEAEAMEAETPTPTQAELDRAKLGDHSGKAGAYKTRQAKAN